MKTDLLFTRRIIAGILICMVVLSMISTLTQAVPPDCTVCAECPNDPYAATCCMGTEACTAGDGWVVCDGFESECGPLGT